MGDTDSFKTDSDRICPSTRSVQDTKILVLFYFRKKIEELYFYFAIIGQFMNTHLTRSLNDTCQLVLCDYMHNNLVGKKCTPFYNCVITGHYMQ